MGFLFSPIRAYSFDMSHAVKLGYTDKIYEKSDWT